MKARTVVAIAVLVPLISVGVAVVPGVVDERWAEMQAWAAKAEQEWRVRDFHRAPVQGDGAPGPAFEAYLDALQQANVLGSGDARLLTDLRLHPEVVTGSAAEDLGRRWRPALTALAGGAHRTDARPAVDLRLGIQNLPISLLSARDLVNAATIEARRRVAVGDGIGAVALLLDAATFAVDLQGSPLVVDQTIAGALLQLAAGELLRDSELQRLDAAALDLLGTGLRLLDERCRVTVDGAGEALLLARSLLGQDAPVGGLPPAALDRKATSGWHYAWSRRWAAADAVLLIVEACEQIRRAATLPWSQRQARLRELEAGLAAQPNAMVRTFAANGSGVERTLRLAATQLRLLRLAVAFHAGGELPVLADPLGDGTLVTIRRDGGAVFRSAGGTDDMPLERSATGR